MWLSYLLVGLLLGTSLVSGAEFYGHSRYGKRTKEDYEDTLPSRDVRSGIFWTGSRYNRRGSGGLKQPEVRPRAERFFMGSRYGKRNSDGSIWTQRPTLQCGQPPCTSYLQ